MGLIFILRSHPVKTRSPPEKAIGIDNIVRRVDSRRNERAEFIPRRLGLMQSCNLQTVLLVAQAGSAAEQPRPATSVPISMPIVACSPASSFDDCLDTIPGIDPGPLDPGMPGPEPDFDPTTPPDPDPEPLPDAIPGTDPGFPNPGITGDPVLT